MKYTLIIFIIFTCLILVIYKFSENERIEVSSIRLQKEYCQNFTAVLSKYNINETLQYSNKSNRISNSYAVFSMAYNYDLNKFKFYIDSLRKTGYQGSIFLFVKENLEIDIYRYLIKNIAEPLYINEIRPYYSKNNRRYFINNRTLDKFVPKRQITGYWKYAIIRYCLLFVFMKKYGKKFKYGFISDFKDIYYQLNPFQWNIQKGVSLFEESRSISFKNDKTNINWILKINNSKTYFAKYYIINSGQMFFTYPEILDFLNQYNLLIDTASKVENDQPIFNIIYYDIIYRNRNIHLYNTYFGPVRLLAGDAIYLIHSKRIKKEKIFFSEVLDYKNGKVINCDGTFPKIIHFYFIKNSELMIDDIMKVANKLVKNS